jgi:hypothetical protein
MFLDSSDAALFDPASPAPDGRSCQILLATSSDVISYINPQETRAKNALDDVARGI